MQLGGAPSRAACAASTPSRPRPRPTVGGARGAALERAGRSTVPVRWRGQPMGRCVAHDSFRCLRMDIGPFKQLHTITVLNPIRFTVERERLTMPPKAAGNSPL